MTHQSSFPEWIQPVIRLLRPAYRKLRPRLGVLEQYPPRPLKLPRKYRNTQLPGKLPTISIVTPSFNQAEFLERTLSSVLDQQYPWLEYFVQDGGSTDGTLALLQRQGHRLAGWDSGRDGGQAHAINLGFSKASGEIMAWLNSDDILLPGALAYVAQFFIAHPEIDVVYGHRVLIDQDDNEIGTWIMPPHENAILSWADFIPQETLFWRRSLWEKTGETIDETFQFAVDWDLIVRFRNAGGRFARLPRLMGGFRIHERQKTSTSIGSIGLEEMARIRQRELGWLPLKIEIDNKIRNYLLQHLLMEWMWRLRVYLKLI